jgi:hypothetical protein
MVTNLDFKPLLKHVGIDEIAAPGDLFEPDALERYLLARGEPPFSVVAVGDIMLGGRASRVLQKKGSDYPFEGVRPLLQRAQAVLGNLEGPLAKRAVRQERNFSYRVHPTFAMPLARAGINILTLANNHLVDCGRDGVLETIDAVEAAGIARIGAGRNATDAHQPAIVSSGPLRIGFLGYYWNRRCAATETLPGSAIDTSDRLQADIRSLRERVDRVVVTFHWGIPYEREPLEQDRLKARVAIDCGADIVIGHHPHVVQPFELYRGRPIFYSLGNFTFGSGNSRGEGLLLGCTFEPNKTTVALYPLYVKNRDPRVDYQPKVLRGASARHVLRRLSSAAGAFGPSLHIEDSWGLLSLPRGPGRTRESPS